jgi:hypothetical protein
MNTNTRTQGISKVVKELKAIVRQAQIEQLDGVSPAFKVRLQRKDLLVLFLHNALEILDDKQLVLMLARNFDEFAEDFLIQHQTSLTPFNVTGICYYACMEAFGETMSPNFQGHKKISQQNKDEVVDAIRLYKELYGEKTGFALDSMGQIVMKLRDEQYLDKTNMPDMCDCYEAYHYYVACEFLKLHKEGHLVKTN